MTEHLPTDMAHVTERALMHVYEVVSTSNFHPLTAIAIPDTVYAVPEIAIVMSNYLLLGTPANGGTIYFERPIRVDGDELGVIHLVITAIKIALDEELSELPDVTARIRALETLMAGGRP